MTLSRRAREIVDSPTLRLNEEARLLRERGQPVIHLGIGEPKNRTPIAAVLSSASQLGKGDVKYTPTDGLPSLKKAIIRYTEDNYGRLVDPENVIVSTGAKQALFNLIYTLLNPQDEVIILAPYWVSYPEMVKMVYGIPVVVVPEDGTFHPRLQDVEAAITSYTRAIIVNSPNNPTGRIYSRATLAALGRLIDERAPGATLLVDEPYRKIVYDGHEVASALQATRRSVLCTSFSKDLGLAGERIGFLAVHPEHPDREPLLNGAIFATRVLGFVNAPAIMQRVVARLGDVSVDIDVYARRRALLLDGLRDAGYRCVTPEGSFYLFPQSPIPDDVQFVQELLQERILVVPGTGFDLPGHFRISYAVPTETIPAALPGFRRVFERLRG
jgi:aspartate aminotransferase